MTAFVAGQAPASRPGLALAFRFALREMRGGLKGFYIFIACIALGVAAISGVTSVSRSLVEGIAAEGTTILGGDLSFRLIHREATQQEYAYLESLGAVSRIATLRAMARAPATGEQTLVEVKGVDDAYPLFGEMSLTAGGALDTALARDGETFGAVVERELLVRLGLSVGDSFTLGRATLTVSDTIEVEPDRLSDGLNFGPRVIVANAAIDASGLVQPGSLVRQNYRVRLDAPDRLDAIVEEAEEAFPEAGWRIRSRANAAPGLQRNIGRLAQFLSLVGMTALLVGGVGVANAVRSFLDAKRPVIATFRCVGADGGFVFRVYLIQILMLTGLGIACGLVLGAAIPFATQGFLATILPVQAIASIYPAELGLGVLYGALTALAFALWPLGRAHDVPPRLLFRDDVSTRHRWPRKRYIAGTALAVGVLAALAIWLSGDTRISMVYVGATASVFLLLSLIARAIMAGARRLPRPRGAELRLALGNIHRPGALTPSVVLSLGLGLSLLVTLALIDGNLRRELGATIALPAVGAAPLLSASAIGAFALRDTPAGAAASPPMLAFTFALICSNLGLLPAVSPFYDACATTALPLSVALGLLAAAAPTTILDETSPQADSTTTALRPMLLAFGIGAIGTLIGSLLAFALSVSSGLLPSTSAAATAAALMCATYIGGSANFFGVATAVDARSNHPALLPALLAADLALMGVYLLGLTAAARSQWLSKAFPEETVATDTTSVQSSPPPPPPPQQQPQRSLGIGVGVSVLAAYTLCLCCAAIETSVLRFPGIGVVLLSIAASASGAAISRLQPTLASKLAPPLTNISLLLGCLFLASIGAPARIAELIAAGPAAALVAATVLTVHVVTLLLGVALSNKSGKLPSVSLRQLLLASNANVGGAGTAVAMAGAMGWSRLIAPAAACGAVGYGLATGVGVGLHALLR